MAADRSGQALRHRSASPGLAPGAPAPPTLLAADERPTALADERPTTLAASKSSGGCTHLSQVRTAPTLALVISPTVALLYEPPARPPQGCLYGNHLPPIFANDAPSRGAHPPREKRLIPIHQPLRYPSVHSASANRCCVALASIQPPYDRSVVWGLYAMELGAASQCSAKRMGLEFHQPGTAIPYWWNCSSSLMEL